MQLLVPLLLLLFLAGLALADPVATECQHLYVSYREVVVARRMRDPTLTHETVLTNYWRHRLETCCPADYARTLLVYA